jgi:hypothetical protein
MRTTAKRVLGEQFICLIGIHFLKIDLKLMPLAGG